MCEFQWQTRRNVATQRPEFATSLVIAEALRSWLPARKNSALRYPSLTTVLAQERGVAEEEEALLAADPMSRVIRSVRGSKLCSRWCELLRTLLNIHSSVDPVPAVSAIALVGSQAEVPW